MDCIVLKNIPGTPHKAGDTVPGEVVATWRTADRLIEQRYLRPLVDTRAVSSLLADMNPKKRAKPAKD